MTNCDFIRLTEIDSTNSYALRNITELTDRTIIIANKQFSGRGRLERKWVSDIEGNVYMSIVLKPTQNINTDLPLANITQYMSVVLCRVLEKYGLSAEIKWPNDVLVEGKKISGILSEVSTKGELLKGYVLGIGINLNCSESIISQIDQPATSLNLLIGETINRDIFITELLDEFFKDYESFLEQGFMDIKSEYIENSGFLGKTIFVNTHLSKDKAIAKSINDDGSLSIVKENQEESIITTGDILLCS